MGPAFINFLGNTNDYLKGALEAATYTDVNDVSVLATGQHANGEPANTTDMAAAAAGVLLPVVSGSAVLKASKAIGGLVDKVAQLAKNVENGKQFEKKVVDGLNNKGNTNIAQQVTIKADNGVKTRVDVVSKDATGKTVLTEAKSSSTAPLTKNQKAAFPSIEKNGGTVVGKNGTDYGFPAGTKIPPTKVQIIKPSNTKEIYINHD